MLVAGSVARQLLDDAVSLGVEAPLGEQREVAASQGEQGGEQGGDVMSR